MAAKIELTPAELLAQSGEMLALQAEFEQLFAQTSSVLTSVNQNWSANLANNFTGKLLSAQKGFSKVTSALEQGGRLAKLSAQTFESMDSLLAKNTLQADMKVMTTSGNSVANKTASLSTASILTTNLENNAENILKDATGNVATGASDAYHWAKDSYNNLPEGVRQDIEAIAGDYDFVIDFLTGKDPVETGLKAVGVLTKANPLTNCISSALKEYPEWVEKSERYEKSIIDDVKDGNYVTATITTVGYTVDGLVAGTVATAGHMLSNAWDGIPGTGAIEWMFGFDVSESIDNATQNFQDSVEYVTEVVSDTARKVETIVNNVVDSINDAGTKAGNAIRDFFGW